MQRSPISRRRGISMWRKLALPPILVGVTLGATGWLYVVRAGGLPGPRVREALPLDELAKHSSAPLLLFVAVWVAAGAVLGAAARWARVQRSVAVIACALGTVLVVYVSTGTSLAVTRQIAARDALHAAERLGSVYLPAVLVALAVALIARPGEYGRRSPADRRAGRRRRREPRAPAHDPARQRRGRPPQPHARRGRPAVARRLLLRGPGAPLRGARPRPPPAARLGGRGRGGGALDRAPRPARRQPRHARSPRRC